MTERRKILGIFVLVAVFLAVNSWASYQATRTIIRNEKSTRQSQSVLNSLVKLFSTLQDAETGQRGYLLTGEEHFLEPYQDARERWEADRPRLEDLAKKDPRFQQRLQRIFPLVDLKMAELQETIEVVHAGHAEKARAIVLSGRGKSLMDELRRVVTEAESEERAELLRLTGESDESGLRALFTFVAVNLLVGAWIALAYYLIQRAFTAREQSQAALEMANAELETRVRQRTTQLQALNAELERSNRELQDFAFVASHDLQEPLRKIQTFGDLLRADFGAVLGPEGNDFLSRMLGASQRMQSLIQDLLTFSRVTTKGQPFVSTDLAKVAREVVDDLEGRIKQTAGRVEIGALPVIEADPVQMRQLLQNLLGNALKFSRPNTPPVVRVVGLQQDGVCHFAVSDNGIGFDEKYLDRIFTPFQRLHGRGEYEGTGMGLAVCRKIVERHGGTITAQSLPGGGSTFLVTLPCTHPEGVDFA